MIDLVDFYILGNPIKTDIGYCRFLTVKEYPECLADLQVMTMSKNEIIYKYHQDNKNGQHNQFIEALKQVSMFEIVLSIQELREAYASIFIRVFENDEILNDIDEKNFDYLRNLVMKMNVQKEEYINPNPEIQKHLERSKRVKSEIGEYTAFSDIIVSVAIGAKISFKEINNWTIYQLYMAFHGVANFQSYQTTTLFATVSPKTKIESWGKHIDLFKQDDHSLTMEEFSKTAKIFEN